MSIQIQIYTIINKKFDNSKLLRATASLNSVYNFTEYSYLSLLAIDLNYRFYKRIFIFVNAAITFCMWMCMKYIMRRVDVGVDKW